MLKFFKSSYFPDYTVDFVHIWYDDKHSSKVLFSNTLPMPVTSRSRSQTEKIYIKFHTPKFLRKFVCINSVHFNFIHFIDKTTFGAQKI